MKFASLIFLIVVLSPRAHAQTDSSSFPRTVEQCRAAATEWNDPVAWEEYKKANPDATARYIPNLHPDALPHQDSTKIGVRSVRELVLRRIKLSACERIDAKRLETYCEIDRFYLRVLSDRYANFLARHQLFQQFMSEDDQGGR